MHTTRTLTIVLSSFVVCFGALAEQDAGQEVPLGNTFKRLDLNDDGKIDRTEAMTEPNVGNRFNAFDSNHDGVITLEELQAYDKAAKTRKADEGKKFDRGPYYSPSFSNQGTGKSKP